LAFDLTTSLVPAGDQPRAIDELTSGLLRGDRFQTLLGVTGSGKTFTMANVIQKIGRPTLVISHNKTLAAQLYAELKGFFPNNAVEFFISYYDYYQPEAYVPSTDTYIEKDTSINDDIDRLRLRATSSLLERDDVIIVASVSCIYGIGSPTEYKDQMLFLERGARLPREKLLRRLVDIHYARNDVDFSRGTFRVRGDTVELVPAYAEQGVRIELFGDEIERLTTLDPVTGKVQGEKDRMAIYPARHFVTSLPRLQEAIRGIESELTERLIEFRSQEKLLEAQRIESRTRYDVEMLKEIGHCAGIENYSRHLSGRKPGERPFCLLDFFPPGFVTVIDESHQTLPQIRGMYAGDRSRKDMLVDYGFRLPSAVDNRPLLFDEFMSLVGQTVFVSATPADLELELSGGAVVEQIIRPTGLVDPQIEVRPLETQVDNLIEEIRRQTEKGERTLVTTLTKRMAEDLSDYLARLGIRVRYLHSEIDAIDRVELLRELRLAGFDVLVGINLLREGLDLPEVSLVAILDADKEGFLRSERSLIQVAGRAARHAEGRVIFYAAHMTDSMQRAISETNRRRERQLDYNREHGIEPVSIHKTREEILAATAFADSRDKSAEELEVNRPQGLTLLPLGDQIDFLMQAMKEAARDLKYEKAAKIRDEIKALKEKQKSEKNRARKLS
jgi:excinuclease ABC subunit B